MDRFLIIEGCFVDFIELDLMLGGLVLVSAELAIMSGNYAFYWIGSNVGWVGSTAERFGSSVGRVGITYRQMWLPGNVGSIGSTSWLYCR